MFRHVHVRTCRRSWTPTTRFFVDRFRVSGRHTQVNERCSIRVSAQHRAESKILLGQYSIGLEYFFPCFLAGDTTNQRQTKKRPQKRLDQRAYINNSSSTKKYLVPVHVRPSANKLRPCLAKTTNTPCCLDNKEAYV